MHCAVLARQVPTCAVTTHSQEHGSTNANVGTGQNTLHKNLCKGGLGLSHTGSHSGLEDLGWWQHAGDLLWQDDLRHHNLGCGGVGSSSSGRSSAVAVAIGVDGSLCSKASVGGFDMPARAS
jgi:hypothetical protein